MDLQSIQTGLGEGTAVCNWLRGFLFSLDMKKEVDVSVSSHRKKQHRDAADISKSRETGGSWAKLLAH